MPDVRLDMEQRERAMGLVNEYAGSDIEPLCAEVIYLRDALQEARAQAAAFRSLLEAWRDEFYFENFEGKYRECKVCGADDTRDHDEGCIVQRTLTTLASAERGGGGA